MAQVCIVIPCYNEEKRLPVEEFLNFYNRSEQISFCFVNDGSSDATLPLLHKLRQGREHRVEVLDLPQNQGKAEAVRQAVLQIVQSGNSASVAYFDADFATPLDQIYLLVQAMEEHPACMLAFGSRVKLIGRVIERSATRHYFGRVFATIVSNLLGLAIYDTQCGAKLVKAELAREVFAEKFISRWLFDVEIFARIVTRHGYRKTLDLLVEVPLQTWIEKGDSRFGPKHLIRVPLELIRIWQKYFG